MTVKEKIGKLAKKVGIIAGYTVASVALCASIVGFNLMINHVTTNHAERTCILSDGTIFGVDHQLEEINKMEGLHANYEKLVYFEHTPTDTKIFLEEETVIQETFNQDNLKELVNVIVVRNEDGQIVNVLEYGREIIDNVEISDNMAHSLKMNPS